MPLLFQRDHIRNRIANAILNEPAIELLYYRVQIKITKLFQRDSHTS